MKGVYYITTPIYYVNDRPHNGHAYTTIATDALARYQRQQGRDVFFLSGTDEHGINIEQAARQRGVNPQQHADEMAAAFRKLWRTLAIDYDRFIRTTDADHRRAALALWQRLQASGDLYRGVCFGAYSQRCKAYYQPEELGEELCPIHRLPCGYEQEENWFFRLSRYQDALERLVRDTDFVRDSRRAATRRWGCCARGCATSRSRGIACVGASPCPRAPGRCCTSGWTRLPST